MLLRCKINNEEYDICQGNTFTDEYNETLDSGSIIIDQISQLQNLNPYDDVIIWDANYECLGYNENGETLFNGYTFKEWDVLSGNPVYEENDTQIFYKHLLVDSFSEEIMNLCGRKDKEKIYKYRVQLFSETKGLEIVQLPNLSITEPLNMSKKISVWEYMNKYVNLYSPKYKRRKKIDNNTYSEDEWEFVSKYKLDPNLKEVFDNVYSPDFTLTSPNLKDVLSRLMIVKDMIPYVKNGVIYAINHTVRNETFDDNPEYVNFVVGNQTSAQYCDGLRTNYSEALSNENSCKYTEYLGFRNYNNALMTLDNMRIETKFPIYKINKMYLCYYKKIELTNRNTNVKTDKIFLCKQDITPLVKLNTERNLLSQDWEEFNDLSLFNNSIKDFSNFKMMTVGYDIGSKYIEGWGNSYKYPNTAKSTPLTIWDVEATYIENIYRVCDTINPYGISSYSELLGEDSNDYTISFPQTTGLFNIVSPFENSSLKLKSFFFQIDYQGMYNGAIVHSKDIGRDDVMISNNPNSGLTLLEKDGLYQKEQLNRFGNKVVTIKARYDDISQLQPLGSVYGDDIIIYHREYAIYDNMILATYIGSKDYVLKNYYTSVYARHRTWNLMSYNEAVTRAENKKLFLVFSNDDLRYEYNDVIKLQNFNKSDFYNFVYSSFLPTKDEDSKIDLGIIEHNQNLYLVDCQSFVSGNSVCFNLAMPDNISSGMNISVPFPDFGEDWDLKLVDGAESLSGMDVDKIIKYMKMSDVEDDYTGSLQDWYPLIDDSDTGFAEKLGFYLCSKKDVLDINKMFDNKDKINKVYEKLFLLPKLYLEWHREKSDDENEYSGKVAINSVVLEKSSFLKNIKNNYSDGIKFIYHSNFNLELYEDNVLVEVNDFIEDLDESILQEWVKRIIPSLILTDKDRNIMFKPTLPIDTKAKFSLISDGKENAKWSFENDELIIQKDEFNKQTIPLEYTPLDAETLGLTINVSKNKKYKISFEFPATGNDDSGWYYGDEKVDLTNSGINLDGLSKDGNFIFIKKEGLSNLKNLVGNEYELWKDNKEKIDMTYQIEFIADKVSNNSILFSPWLMKLNSLFSNYEKYNIDTLDMKKIDNSTNKKFDLSLWSTLYVTKYYNAYPIIFLTIRKDKLEVLKNTFNEASNEDEKIYITSDIRYTKAKGTFLNFLVTSGDDTVEITWYQLQTKFISNIDDESITINCAEKYKCNDSDYNKTSNSKTRVFEKIGSYMDEGGEFYVFRCKIEDLKKFRKDDKVIRFRAWLGKEKAISNRSNIIPKETNNCKLEDSEILYKNISLTNEKEELKTNSPKNMYIVVSNKKMNKDVVYNSYQFINEYNQYNNYKIGDLAYIEENETKFLLQCENNNIKNYVDDINKFELVYIDIRDKDSRIISLDKYKLEKYINSDLEPYVSGLLDEGTHTINFTYNVGLGYYFEGINMLTDPKMVTLADAGIDLDDNSLPTESGDTIFVTYDALPKYQGFKAIETNPYLHGGHLYRKGWTQTDWEKENITLLNSDITDVFANYKILGKDKYKNFPKRDISYKNIKINSISGVQFIDYKTLIEKCGVGHHELKLTFANGALAFKDEEAVENKIYGYWKDQNTQERYYMNEIVYDFGLAPRFIEYVNQLGIYYASYKTIELDFEIYEINEEFYYKGIQAEARANNDYLEVLLDTVSKEYYSKCYDFKTLAETFSSLNRDLFLKNNWEEKEGHIYYKNSGTVWQNEQGNEFSYEELVNLGIIPNTYFEYEAPESKVGANLSVSDKVSSVSDVKIDYIIEEKNEYITTFTTSSPLKPYIYDNEGNVLENSINSIQYWYVNENSMEFVFGINLTEEEKQNKIVTKYISLLSSRDDRVFDENHNLIGEVWNYAGENYGRQYGTKQYYLNYYKDPNVIVPEEPEEPEIPDVPTPPEEPTVNSNKIIVERNEKIVYSAFVNGNEVSSNHNYNEFEIVEGDIASVEFHVYVYDYSNYIIKNVYINDELVLENVNDFMAAINLEYNSELKEQTIKVDVIERDN